MKTFLATLACLMLLVGAPILLTCCAGNEAPTVENALKATSYGAQLAECNARSKSLEESRECRCLVAQAWGRVCMFPADGGSDG